MRYYCSDSQNSKLIVDRFVETCDANNMVFLTGPKGSDFYPLIREYAASKGWSDESVLMCSHNALNEQALGDIAALLKGVVPEILAVKVPVELDEIEHRELIAFLDNPGFANAKWIILLDGVDPFENENPYPDQLLSRAKEAMFVLPSLRMRKADLAFFAINKLHLVEQKIHGSKDFRFSEEAIDLMLNYDWPGNYSELSRVMSVIGSSYDPKTQVSESVLEQTISMGRTSEIILD